MSNIKNNFLSFFFLMFIRSFSYSQDNIVYFQAKSHISFSQDGNTQEFTAHIRYNLKDTLWISITGVLGMEGGRMIITSDSTFVYNKIEKSFHEFLNSTENVFIPYQFQLEDWKLVLLNMPPELDSFSTQIIHSDTTIKTLYSKNQTIFTYVLEGIPIKCRFKNNLNQTECIMHLSQFDKNDIWPIAKTRFFKINCPNSVQISVRYVDYKFNKPKSFPFNFAKYRNASN